MTTTVFAKRRFTVLSQFGPLDFVCLTGCPSSLKRIIGLSCLVAIIIHCQGHEQLYVHILSTLLGTLTHLRRYLTS